MSLSKDPFPSSLLKYRHLRHWSSPPTLSTTTHHCKSLNTGHTPPSLPHTIPRTARERKSDNGGFLCISCKFILINPNFSISYSYSSAMNSHFTSFRPRSISASVFYFQSNISSISAPRSVAPTKAATPVCSFASVNLRKSSFSSAKSFSGAFGLSSSRLESRTSSIPFSVRAMAEVRSYFLYLLLLYLYVTVSGYLKEVKS